MQGLPTVPESNSISEGTFVEGEAELLQREGSEPA